MTAFVDSSALVKRYVNEAGTPQLRAVAGPVVVSAIARVDVVSALRRLARERRDLVAGEVLEAVFLADWHARVGSPGSMVRVHVRQALLERAGQLVARHELRTLDAIQLASALVARDASPQVDRFLTFDIRLGKAAQAEGFRQ